MSYATILVPRFSELQRAILEAEVEAASKAHWLADDEFGRSCSTRNVGWQVLEASDKQFIARQALLMALARLNDFMRHGTVSENCDNPGYAEALAVRPVHNRRTTH